MGCFCKDFVVNWSPYKSTVIKSPHCIPVWSCPGGSHVSGSVVCHQTPAGLSQCSLGTSKDSLIKILHRMALAVRPRIQITRCIHASRMVGVGEEMIKNISLNYQSTFLMWLVSQRSTNKNDTDFITGVQCYHWVMWWFQTSFKCHFSKQWWWIRCYEISWYFECSLVPDVDCQASCLTLASHSMLPYVPR